jgi:hypothetical protein
MKLFKDQRVIIEEEVNGNTFRDALYYDVLPDDKEIETEAQARIDAYIFTIENPPEEVPLTKEEIQKMLDQAVEQKERLEVFISEKTAELVTAEIDPIEDPIEIIKG